MESKINNLTPSQWLFRSKSVWRRTFSSKADAQSIRRVNKSCKPPKLCKEIIEVFSKEGNLVFDAFAGTGGIAIGAQMANRLYMGCELEPIQVEAYQNACSEMSSLFLQYDASLIKNEDFFKAFSECKESFVDLVFTDPPYFDIDRRKKSKRIWKDKGSMERPMEAYGQCRFNNLDEWKSFIRKWGEISRKMLKPNKYLVYFMEDVFIDGEYVFLSHIVADILKEVGFVPQGEYLWYNEGRRPGFFGFPSKMITNRTHTSIVFMINSKQEKDNV